MEHQPVSKTEQTEKQGEMHSGGPLALTPRRTRAHPIRRLQRLAGNQAVQRLVRKGLDDRVLDRTNATNNVVQQVLSDHTAGQPLDRSVRDALESRIAQNLEAVRVHTDSRASRLAAGVQARAFTLGQNIYFNQRQYQSTTKAGMKLLVHELVHVVQQMPPRSSTALIGVRAGRSMSSSSDLLEREADSVAARIETGGSISTSSVSSCYPCQLQRAPIDEEERTGSAGKEAERRAARRLLDLRVEEWGVRQTMLAATVSARRSAEQEQLERQFPKLALLTVEELVGLLEEPFLRQFEDTAIELTREVLDQAEEVVLQEQDRYTGRRRPPARRLAEHRSRMGGGSPTALELFQSTRRPHPKKEREALMQGARELSAILRREAGERAVRVLSPRALRTLESLQERRQEITDRFPILNDVARTELERFGSVDDQGEAILERIRERLDSIDTVRRNIGREGEYSVWKSPHIVNLTKRQLEVLPHSWESRWVDSHIREIQQQEFATEFFLGVVAFVLSILATPTAAAIIFASTAARTAFVLAAASVSATINLTQLVNDIQEFEYGYAARRTHFDPDLVLSQTDPAQWPIALAIMGLFLDAADCVQAVGTIARPMILARQAPTLGGRATAQAAEEAAEQARRGMRTSARNYWERSSMLREQIEREEFVELVESAGRREFHPTSMPASPPRQAVGPMPTATGEGSGIHGLEMPEIQPRSADLVRDVDVPGGQALDEFLEQLETTPTGARIAELLRDGEVDLSELPDRLGLEIHPLYPNVISDAAIPGGLDVDELLLELERTANGAGIAELIRSGELHLVVTQEPLAAGYAGMQAGRELGILWQGDLQNTVRTVLHEGAHFLDEPFIPGVGWLSPDSRLSREALARTDEYEYAMMRGLEPWDDAERAYRDTLQRVPEETGDIVQARIAAEWAMIEQMAREPERYGVETLEQLTQQSRDLPLEFGPPRMPTLEESRSLGQSLYEQYRSLPDVNPNGPHGAIHPDLETYPTLEIRPSGLILGSYEDVLRFLGRHGLTRRGRSPTQAHHLFEDHFARYFGFSEQEGRAVGVVNYEHAMISGEMAAVDIPRRGQVYDIDELFDETVEMYEALDEPELIDEMRTFLRQNKNRIRERYDQGLVPGAQEPGFPQRRQRVEEWLERL